MEDFAKHILNQITSYDIFNNLFPGVVFSIVIEHTTRFCINTETVWEKLFICYFIGMIISRIGSIIVCGLLKLIKIKNNDSEGSKEECLIIYAPYEDYIEASENSSIITILNETNNTYRTIIAMLILTIIVKIVDWWLYDKLNCFKWFNNIIFILICVLLIILFIFSYKKQTDHIRQRVEKYIKSLN